MLLDLPWYYWALATAVFWAVCTLVEKEQLDHESTLEYVTVISIFTLVASVFLLPWVNWALPWQYMAIIYLSAVLGTFSMWMGSKGLRHLDVSVAAPLFNLNVLFTVLLGALVLGERFTFNQGIGVAILLIGSLLLTRDRWDAPIHFHLRWPTLQKVKIDYRSPGFYHALIVGCMVLVAINGLIGKVTLNYVDVISLVFFSRVFGAFNHLLVYIYVNKTKGKFYKHMRKAGWRMVLISVLTIISQLTFAKSLSLGELALVVPVQRTSSAISTVLGGLIRKEKAMLFRMAVSVAMVAGVWLVVK